MKTRPSWFAHPWLSLLLGLSWLLLQHSLSLLHLLSAVAIGLVVPRLLHGFLPSTGRLRMVPALRLLAVVLWDIVLSNITVARLVLGSPSRLRPAWVPVPCASMYPTRAGSMPASAITRSASRCWDTGFGTGSAIVLPS